MNKIKKFLLSFLDFINGNTTFILLLWLSNSYTMAIYLIDDERIYTAYMVFGITFLITLGITFLLSKVPITIKKILQYLLLIPSIIGFITEFITLKEYNALIGTGIMNSILESNIREMREFVFSTILSVDIVLVTFTICICILFIYTNNFKLPLLIKKIFNIILGLWLILSIGFTTDLVVNYRDFLGKPIIPLQRIEASFKSAYENMKAYKELSTNLNTNVDIIENNADIPNVVFILGEATNRNHMHLYGYDLPTTPNLDRLHKNGDIIFYTNVISPHSTTIAVLSKLFTFANYESNIPWYKYNNFIDIMKSAGYKTFWLSNQESSGIWGNVAQVYADRSDYHKFTRIRDSREDFGVEDGALFPLIDEAKNYKGEKNFYVIHLMGCHIAYYNRYPYAFSRFKESDINRDLSLDQKKLIAQYDNAIFYNDFVVSSIMEKFQNEDTLIIYLPDHSEAIFDEGSNINGHVEENATRNMIEVPMIIWGSKTFRKKHAHLWEKLIKARNNPYMTDDMIHTLLDIMAIKTRDFDPTRSVINEKYNKHRKRLFNNMDYDLDLKNKHK